LKAAEADGFIAGSITKTVLHEFHELPRILKLAERALGAPILVGLWA